MLESHLFRIVICVVVSWKSMRNKSNCGEDGGHEQKQYAAEESQVLGRLLRCIASIGRGTCF